MLGVGERDSKNHFKLLLKMTVMGYGGDSQRTYTSSPNPCIWMAAPHMYIVCQNPVKHWCGQTKEGGCIRAKEF